MSKDDKINIAILVFAILFVAIMFPLAIKQNEDAEFGRIVRESFPK